MSFFKGKGKKKYNYNKENNNNSSVIIDIDNTEKMEITDEDEIKTDNNITNEEEKINLVIETDKKFICAFVGLPSSGKSTLINSLIGKRILQSGICRTTTELNTLTDNVIKDDDGNEFIAMDLPGICDGNADKQDDITFNDLTYENITNANMVYFVSDISKAFITTHEIDEYFKIKKILADSHNKTGTIHSIAIILSKCDFDSSKTPQKYANPVNNTNTNTNAKNKKKQTVEIIDDDEETDLYDLLENVRRKLPDEDIYLFNAFGRIMHSPYSTDNIKTFIQKKNIVATRHNIGFSITKYYANIWKKQEVKYIEKFNYYYGEYESSVLPYESTKLDNVVDSFMKINKINRYEHFINMIFKNSSSYETAPNYKFYDFYEKVSPSFQIYKSITSKYLLMFKIGIINTKNILLLGNKDNSKIINKIANETTNEKNTLLEEISLYMEDITEDDKEYIFNRIIFRQNIFENEHNAIIFLTEFYEKYGGFANYNFKQSFNKFIYEATVREFNKFYSLMIKYCETYENVELPKLQYDEITKYLYRCVCGSVKGHETQADGRKYWYENTTQSEPNTRCKTCNAEIIIENESDEILQHEKLYVDIDKYFIDIERMVSDNKYILYNKLQLIHGIKNKCEDICYGNNIYEFKKYKMKITNGNDIITKIIKNHSKFTYICSIFYNKLIKERNIKDINKLNYIFTSINELIL